jgi:protein-L-isoaspartate(D-aspartate) O-methyltransferase
VPLTNAEWWGCFVMITRLGSNPDRYRARFAGRVGVIPCTGGRDQAAEERLKVAFARGDFTAIRSLRRAPEEPDETCWLAGEEWWLSTAPVPKRSV